MHSLGEGQVSMIGDRCSLQNSGGRGNLSELMLPTLSIKVLRLLTEKPKLYI